MDPQYPVNTNVTPGSAQPQPGPFAPPPKRSFLSRKVLIIAGLVLVVLIVLFAVMNGSRKTSKTNSPGTDPTVYVQREGYKDVSEGIGDATAIFAEPTSTVAQFAGQNVLQPCAMVSLDDIKKNGLLLAANSLTGPVERQFYDGRGSQVQPKLSTILLPSTDEENVCTYYLQDNRGVIALSGLQPFNASELAIQDDLEGYSPVADVEGLKTYKKTKANSFDQNESTYIIRGTIGSIVARLSLPDQSKKDAILKVIATNLKKAGTTPTSVTKFTYKSPVMTKSVFTNCDVLSDASFKQAMGLDASPLTNEKFASSIGVIQHLTNKKLYNYATYDCRRPIADKQGTGYIVMQTHSYESEDMAKFDFTYQQRPDALAANIQAVTPAIGDESFFGDPAQMRNALVMRKGRLIIHISHHNDSKSFTPTERIATLRPVLESALSKGMFDGF